MKKNKKKIITVVSTVLIILLGFVFAVPAAAAPDQNYWYTTSLDFQEISHSGNATRINDTLWQFQQHHHFRLYVYQWNNKRYFNGYVYVSLPLTITVSHAHAANIQFLSVENTLFETEIVDTVCSTDFGSYNTSGYYSGTIRMDITVKIPIQGILPDSEFYFDLVPNWQAIYNVESGYTASWSYSWGSNTQYYDLAYTESDIDTLQDIKNRISSGNTAITNHIDAAASQAASDAAVTHDILTVDHTGTSTNLDGIKSDYDVAESAAAVAVDGSVHNYSSDLSTVENYDFSSFFTSQRSAATFWRDVGEYILNSSNLGFIASGVIITTLITLFVFLLRL